MEKNLVFEELEQVEDLGWGEAAGGIVIGGAIAYIVYAGILMT